MKTTFVSDLSSGNLLTNEPLLFHEVSRRKTKDARPFLLGSLRDKTGQLACVFWDVPDFIEAKVRPGKVFLITGRVVKYKDALQISITDLNDAPSADMRDFLPSSNRSRQEMIAELRQFIAGLGEPWRSLLNAILLDPQFLSQFVNAPAAKQMHHAYIGGLLEHTLSMATIADQLSNHYPYVNKNRLIAGTLLHDIGKVVEYKVDEGFAYSEDGRLVGHIIRGIIIIEKAAAKLDNFPDAELRDLIHLIASHHGTQEWGSPILPKTVEAVLLHQIDLLDSRVQGFLDYVKNDSGADPWTGKYSLMFKTELRKPTDMP